MSKQGFIYLHRKLKSHWIFQESDYLKTWIHLLFDAAYEDGSMLVGKQIVQLKRGQLVFGRKAYGAKIGLSEGRLRRFLNLLKDEGMIDQQTTNKFSIISIINYDDYQTHDKQTTIKQLSNDKQTTTNNKYNKYNKTFRPKLSEVMDYFAEKNCLNHAEEFFEYWEDKDWSFYCKKTKTRKEITQWRRQAGRWIANQRDWQSEKAEKKKVAVHPIYGEII